MTGWRLGYAAATAGLAGAGWTALVRLAGWRAGDVALGLGAAWTIQVVSFWILAGRLWRGENAFGAWTAGIAARLAGLAVLWAVGWAAGRSGPDLVGSYALALLVFLLAEAAWLGVGGDGRRRSDGSAERRATGGNGE